MPRATSLAQAGERDLRERAHESRRRFSLSITVIAIDALWISRGEESR
jgi:hypothetical protein